MGESVDFSAALSQPVTTVAHPFIVFLVYCLSLPTTPSAPCGRVGEQLSLLFPCAWFVAHNSQINIAKVRLQPGEHLLFSLLVINKNCNGP